MIDRHYLSEHFPELDHLSPGGLLGALDIDPTPIPQPDMSFVEALALLQAQVDAEKAAREAAA